MRGRIFLAVLSAGLSLSCSKSFEDPDAIERNETVLERMASNIGFFRDLAVAVEAEGKVAAWIQDTDHVTVYWDNGRVSTVWPDPSVGDAVPPTVSAALQDGRLVWSVNGEVPTKGGKAIPVSYASAPVLSTEDADWVLAVAGERFTFKPDACVKARKACVGIDPSRPMTFRLEPGTEVYVEQPAWFKDLKTRDVNRAFYKDIFLDAGVGLTPRKSLAAAKKLGLSLEGMTGREDANKGWQQAVLGGSPEDTNGRLLYPDGQPRYRVLFVNGGVSTTHGEAMENLVRSRMKDFFQMGGSYVGTCAGGFFASADKDCFLHLWPGKALQTGIMGENTDFVLETDTPLLKYSDFGGDSRIKEVRQNGGCFAGTFPAGTEVLALYDYPSNPSVHHKPSVWAYKSSQSTGRAVLTGGHPEEVSNGERLDLTAAMLQYAMDGQGLTMLKGVLINGRTRYMAGEENRIGDLQCHHFAFWMPEGAGPVDISVSGEISCDWDLSLSREGFAYPDDASYTVSESRLHIEDLSPGLWYLSVRCATTVTATETELTQEYSGRTDVLNGVPYRIVVNWTEN